MKTTKVLGMLVLIALLGRVSVSVRAQGLLLPPGGPSPMMKSLQEMEPRRQIATLPFTITNSGSYYLATNLNGGSTLAGIVIQASGVTIDLRGFSIADCTTGISAGAAVQGVTIHNGFVRGCAGDGIALGSVGQIRLEGVTVSHNGGDGASVGEGAIVTLCAAAGNGGRGLALGNGGEVFRCVAKTNAGSGIVLSSNGQATENVCVGNGSGTGEAGLLTTGNGNRVEGNSANQNNGHGFKIGGTANLVIRNNACGNTTTDYSVGAGNNYGQLLASPGAAFVNANPWANISCNQATVCGNGAVESGEGCDDGNTMIGDGCSATCAVESGYSCLGSPSVCTPMHTLTVDKAGIGIGTVTSSPAGIICGADCSESYNHGTMVTLLPLASVGSIFAGWSGGGCSGTGSCAVTMDAAKSVTATFFLYAVCGNGAVESGEGCDDGNTTNGDGCSATCAVESGYTCSSEPSVCTLNPLLTVSRAGSGSGIVTSTPAGINCGADCTESYTSGTMVTLTASASGGSTFTGWSGGGCSGTGTCNVTLASAVTVTATFTSP